MPDETKTLVNTAILRILLSGSLVKKVEVSNDEVLFYLKEPGINFDLIGFFIELKILNTKIW